MKPKSGNRFRVCGTPSKTGCITCKIRRVKCGEEHPFCKRCTSTGRKCDGYAPPKSPDRSSRKTTPRALSRGPSATPEESEPMEQQFIYIFRTSTAPKLPGHFSPKFWEQRVYHASNIEPSIRHAIIAIAAIHQDYVNWQQNQVVDPSIQPFAFRQYTKAIGHLHQLMSTQTEQLDLTLIACICFITFDCLLGNHESAIIHLRSGLKILEDIRSRMSPGSTRIHEWESEFAPVLLSLGTQAASFVNPNHDVDRSELWLSLRSVGSRNIMPIFHSLEDARYALDSIAANITVERNTAAAQPPILNLYPMNPRDNERTRQISSIHAWSKAMDDFLLESAIGDPLTINRTNLGGSLLKLHSLIYHIVVQTPLNSTGIFQEVLVHCEYLVNSRLMSGYEGEDLSFTPEMGVIAPLFFTVLRAPDTSVQQRALDLLSRAHGREGMWDTQDALRIAGEALEAAGYEDWTAQSPITSTFPPQPEGRLRSESMDRMVWPFGERWEIPVSSTHTTPQLEYAAPYTSSSTHTTPHSATEPTFSQMPILPHMKAEPAFASSANTTPQMGSEPAFSRMPIPPQVKVDSGYTSSPNVAPPMANNMEFPGLLQPNYDWASFD
ncbi:hypothetical protein BJ875DRAFT_541323 [Amylocarpus encephaloides]|uniref:Zn(2)-C6 fungal-type domain-containing protein n=1 Tax=Amylocarpus encephaloides TaxID=45428 RepID=A0A9P7YMR4_9HELO|nr:hypothetical protein BJ875DRAFT_541323 [Amylocarpus encephaloides]